MKWSLILLAVFGVAAASPIDKRNIQEVLFNGGVSRNSVIEGQLRGLLEDFRNTMLTGSDTVPVLDPLKVDFLAIDENVVPVPQLYVEVGDATVTQLSTFVVDVLSVTRTTIIPLRYRLDFDLAIPALEVDARHYNLFVPVQGLTIFGTGDAKISIVEPRLSGHVIARPALGFGTIYIRLEQCQINFKLKGFEPQINGLLGGDPAVNEFVNSFLRFLVPDLVKLYEDVISETLSSLVLDVGNDILSDINLIGILG